MRNIDFEEGNLEPLDERGTAGTKNIHDYADFETLLNENHYVLFLRVAGVRNGYMFPRMNTTGNQSVTSELTMRLWKRGRGLLKTG